MTHKLHDNWMANIENFLARHPEREYLLRDITPASMQLAAAAGWIVGAASSPPGMSPGLLLVKHDPAWGKSIACVVRRPAPEEGRFVPSVFLLDGARTPPLPKGSARDEEQSAAAMWAMFEAAAAHGMSMVDFVMGRGGPAFMQWAQGRKI